MGHLSCLFKNGAEGCKMQVWKGPGACRDGAATFTRLVQAWNHRALAVAMRGWEEGSIELGNIGASAYGVGLGVHRFLIPLWRASQPRLSCGWTEARPGCLWCFGLYPLLLFRSSYHEETATQLRIWRPLNTALGDILVPIENIPPFLLPNPLNFQPLFLLWWRWHWLSIQVVLTSFPLHPCCQPVFKLRAKRSRSKGALETKLLSITCSLLQRSKSNRQSCRYHWGVTGTYSAHTGLWFPCC